MKKRTVALFAACKEWRACFSGMTSDLPKQDKTDFWHQAPLLSWKKWGVSNFRSWSTRLHFQFNSAPERKPLFPPRKCEPSTSKVIPPQKTSSRLIRGCNASQTFFGRLAVCVHRMVCQGRKKCLDAEGWWPVFPLSHLPKTQRRGKLKTPRKSNVWDFFFSD